MFVHLLVWIINLLYCFSDILINYNNHWITDKKMHVHKSFKKHVTKFSFLL